MPHNFEWSSIFYKYPNTVQKWCINYILSQNLEDLQIWNRNTCNWFLKLATQNRKKIKNHRYLEQMQDCHITFKLTPILYAHLSFITVERPELKGRHWTTSGCLVGNPACSGIDPAYATLPTCRLSFPGVWPLLPMVCATSSTFVGSLRSQPTRLWYPRLPTCVASPPTVWLPLQLLWAL